MQTFLPYKDFKKTAKVLDYRRLGKQRVEAMQIVQSIENNTGWRHHPIVKMWTPYIDALKLYHNIIIIEWLDRGYNNNMSFYDISNNIHYPRWLGYEPFHESHRANLLRKDYEFYSRYNWHENPELPYIWLRDVDNKWYNT